MLMPEADDLPRADEPAAYWTKLTYESVIKFIRAEQARRGFSQPQFWILRHLSPQDLLADDRGLTLAELQSAMAEYIRPEDDLPREAALLLERGFLRRDGEGRLFLTDAGEEARLAWKAFAPEIRALVHRGIDDADYVAALKVMQRLIRNTSDPVDD